jgi:hypothetical protein
MELIAAILSLGIVAAPLALLGAWLAASTQRGLGTVVPKAGEGWWRAALPWPQGVQEEDGPGWSVASAPTAGAEAPESGSAGQAGDDADEMAAPHLTRLHPTIRAR